MEKRLILIFVIGTHMSRCTTEWSFKEQDKWPVVYCQKGLQQSPIDLVDEGAVLENDTSLVFKNFDLTFNATLSNYGHMIGIEFSNEDPMTVSGGSLPGDFQLERITVHWDSTHTLNGVRKPLESHFYMFNVLFDNVKEAEKFTSGIAILTILYEFADEDNIAIKPITDHLEKVVKAKTSTDIQLNPKSLFPGNITNFYRYWGSRIIPDCEETVVWTIFTELCTVSRMQLEKFSSLKDGNGEKINQAHRNIQQRHGRNIYKISTA